MSHQKLLNVAKSEMVSCPDTKKPNDSDAIILAFVLCTALNSAGWISTALYIRFLSPTSVHAYVQGMCNAICLLIMLALYPCIYIYRGQLKKWHANQVLSARVNELYAKKEAERIDANKQKELGEIRAQLCKDWGITE